MFQRLPDLGLVTGCRVLPYQMWPLSCGLFEDLSTNVWTVRSCPMSATFPGKERAHTTQPARPSLVLRPHSLLGALAGEKERNTPHAWRGLPSALPPSSLHGLFSLSRAPLLSVSENYHHDPEQQAPRDSPAECAGDLPWSCSGQRVRLWCGGERFLLPETSLMSNSSLLFLSTMALEGIQGKPSSLEA